MKSLLFLFLAFLLSCNQSKKETKSVFLDTIKYDNGNIYSLGKYQLTIKNEDTNYIKQGEWKFNYPNGSLWNVDKLDKNGKLIESSYYYSQGGLKRQYKSLKDIEETRIFNTNGALISLDIYKSQQCREERLDFKIFYDNGMILEEYTFINNKSETDIFYDSSGKKVLSIIVYRGRSIKD